MRAKKRFYWYGQIAAATVAHVDLCPMFVRSHNDWPRWAYDAFMRGFRDASRLTLSRALATYRANNPELTSFWRAEANGTLPAFRKPNDRGRVLRPHQIAAIKLVGGNDEP